MTSPVAVVTGAASGIGRECARMLLGSGHNVTAIDLRDDALREAFPDESSLHVVAADVGDPRQCAAAVGDAAQHWGRIDSLLHFAAVWTGRTWDQTDEAEWQRILQVNVTGTFFLAKAAAEHMIPQGQGAIVLTASVSAKIGGVAGGPAYVASKGAVIAMTHSLAKALGPSGIRVNAVNPGVVRTPMTAAWSEAVKAKTIELTPLGRLAEADDIAGVACFLVSDAARFVTGEVLEVNGGFYFS